MTDIASPMDGTYHHEAVWDCASEGADESVIALLKAGTAALLGCIPPIVDDSSCQAAE